MFTGLVEELGSVKELVRGIQSFRLIIKADKVLSDIKLGDSIAVNGVCLTVVEFGSSWFKADVMPETVLSTVLGSLNPNDAVNLERTLKVGDRLGGHIVSGHVDGVGKILGKQQFDNAVIIKIEAEKHVLRYIVRKGSIAIDGISLTVVECTDSWFTVSIIPHTLKMTTLGIKSVGSQVNLETDFLGRYVEKFLQGGSKDDTVEKKSGLTLDKLITNGF